jgi:hypothetical protein
LSDDGRDHGLKVMMDAVVSFNLQKDIQLEVRYNMVV